MLPPLSARKGLLSCGFLVCFLTHLIVQISPASGGDYPIGGGRAGDQTLPSVSLHATGGYLVWQDNTVDGTNGSGIAALALGSDWTATGAVFRVNQQLKGSQNKPQAVALGDGGTLVLWFSRLGAHQNIYGRVLTNGAFATGDTLVSTPTITNSPKYLTNWSGVFRNRAKQKKFRLRDRNYAFREATGGAAVAALPDGGAVVVYDSSRRYETNTWTLVRQIRWTGRRMLTNDLLQPLRIVADNMQDVFLQRLDNAGKKVGDEIRVNQSIDYNQRSPAVAVLANGNLVVAWVSESPRSQDWRDNFRVEVFGRFFSPQGEPLGGEFLISVRDDILLAANPALAALANGGFVALWSQQESPARRRWDVYGRVFGSDGTAGGPAFVVNTYTAGDQYLPKVCGAADRQLVVWTSVGQDGSREGVYGRWLLSGAPGGEEFRVNSTTISRQMHPALGTDGQGRWLAVWSSYVGATGFDLFGQQYSAPVGSP
jgi:hypothetical protein